MGKVKQQQQDMLDAAEPGPDDTNAYIASDNLNEPQTALNSRAGSMRGFFGLLFLFALGLATLMLSGCDPTARIVDCVDGCGAEVVSMHEVAVEVPVACEVPESLPDSCRIVSENKNKYVIHCDKAAE